MRADMQGRTCLITGATDGHGKAMAHALSARGADLVLLARNREKAALVQEEIAEANGGKTPDVILADLASADEIDLAVEGYLSSGRPLHLLVNDYLNYL